MKKNAEYIQKLINQRFDWEDKKKINNNKMWKLRNENLQASQQIGLINSQLRIAFGRKEIEDETKQNL